MGLKCWHQSLSWLENAKTSDDSSKRSLKCVLLHNGNVYAAVPVGHSVCLREGHNDIKTGKDQLKYHKHLWTICVDLKMVNFLLGKQKWFTKYPCFIYMWESWARDKHWNQKLWPLRETLKVGLPNIVNNPIIDREKLIFPSLLIKLGLMKQFVRALNNDGESFQHIVLVLPALSFENIKAGVFNGPQIRALVWDQDLVRKMKDKERGAWFSFVAVMKNLLCNKKGQLLWNLCNKFIVSF